MHIPHSQLSSPSGRPPPHSTQPPSLPPTPTSTPAQLEPASSFPSSTYSINLSNPSRISPPRALAPGRASALPNRRYFKTKHPLSSGSTSTSKQVRICSCLGKAKLIFDCTISACSSVALALTMAPMSGDTPQGPSSTASLLYPLCRFLSAAYPIIDVQNPARPLRASRRTRTIDVFSCLIALHTRSC